MSSEKENILEVIGHIPTNEDISSEHINSTTGIQLIEAPVTYKAYLRCAFTAFGEIYFGYDSGYISGVMGMNYFLKAFADGTSEFPAWKKSLVTSILSAGTFFGAIIAGDFADLIGRRYTIILGAGVFLVGVSLQAASTTLEMLVVGRLLAGFGVGFVSAIIILYMSEISPKKVRGAMVSGYRFCITIGLLLASCVDYGTQNRNDSGSYRIPIAIQILWALILSIGLLLLPESPRFYVKREEPEKARRVLARLRDQPKDSHYLTNELAEIIANNEIEKRLVPHGSYFSSWLACFLGSIFTQSSNLRRTIFGTSIQMMQQFTGINFIFYFGTTFFQQLKIINNPFLIGLITTLVNVCSTPISFYLIEKYGRRPLLFWGAVGMCTCEFIAAIIGTVFSDNADAIKVVIAFICIYIFFFASTWGPGAWVLVGEIFPLPIRARGVSLSVASNWLWNCIIAVITPFMVNEDKGNLGAKVFFVWGALCFGCVAYAYFLVPETKGLTLEQVDRMLEEANPRNSVKWKPSTTYAQELEFINDEEIYIDQLLENYS